MVNVGYGQETAEEAAWGMLAGRSIPTFNKFTVETPPGSKNYVDLPIGTSYTGVVKELPKQYQATDMTSRELKFYKDGNPIMEVSIVLDTQYRTPGDDEDTGVRICRLGSAGKRALQDEMRRLGIKRFGIGTAFTMTFTNYGVNPSGGRLPKVYSITLVPTEYVAVQQQQVEATLAQTAQQFPQATSAQAQQYQQAVAATPQQQVVQQVPTQVVQQHSSLAGVDPALLALAQAAQAAQAGVVPPQAVTPPSLVTQQHVDNVNMLIASNIARDVAIQAVADQTAPGNAEFRTALDANIPF